MPMLSTNQFYSSLDENNENKLCLTNALATILSINQNFMCVSIINTSTNYGNKHLHSVFGLARVIITIPVNPDHLDDLKKMINDECVYPYTSDKLNAISITGSCTLTGCVSSGNGIDSNIRSFSAMLDDACVIRPYNISGDYQEINTNSEVSPNLVTPTPLLDVSGVIDETDLVGLTEQQAATTTPAVPNNLYIIKNSVLSKGE